MDITGIARDAITRITNSNRPCSRCSKIQFSQFAHKPEFSVSGGQSTKYIIDLRSILSKRDTCNFCRLLFLALCLPENDPLQNDEIQTSIKKDPALDHKKSRDPPYNVSFATWASERTRPLINSDAKWPFGYTYDNVGMGNSREAASNQTSAESNDAVEFKEGGALPDRSTGHGFRWLSMTGLVTAKRLDNNAERNRWYSWATKIIPDSVFLDAMFRNKVPAALKLVIYDNQHEKSGIIEAEFWGAPKARGRDILALSKFNLRVASPDPALTEDRQLRYGRVVDRTKIDLDLCHSWLTHCRNMHDETCNTPSWASRLQKPHGLTFRLIDVNNKCVAEKDSRTCDFAALSYVWGAREDIAGLLRLETSTMQKLFTPGSIDYSVGNTIKDAIAVAMSLDIRYLWVDRLCIIQDDKEDMETQIGQMDRIYGNAVVTIVAATSKNLHAGIPGVTTQRSVDQLAGQVCNAPVVNVLVPIQSDNNLGPWDGRAWTFQEKLLSKRLLLFNGGMVDFHCRCGVMREDMTARDAGVVPPAIGWLSLASDEVSSSLKPQTYEGQPPRLLRSPVFAEYAALIEHYTPRRMSNASDAVSAILSLLKILVQSERGGATRLRGLVEEFFDQALHWLPAAGENVRLRLRTGRDGASRFPTWSWAAWEPVEDCDGGVRYEVPFRVQTDQKGALQKVVLDDASEAPEERMRPLIRWFIPETPDSQALRPAPVPRQKSFPGTGILAAPQPTQTRPEMLRTPPQVRPKPERFRTAPAPMPKPDRLRSQRPTNIIQPMNRTGIGIAFKSSADLERWETFLDQGNNDKREPKLSALQISTILDGNCLVFKARSTRFRLGKTQPRTEILWQRADNTSDVSSKLIPHTTLHMNETAIMNNRGLEVGRVVLPDPVAYQQSDKLYDFIMLSEAQYYGDEVNVDVGDHPLLNIMMIEWHKNRTFATRLALGKMNKKDWRSALGREELIILK